jgi:transcriptional regulator with XRE-family HTH domain
MEDDVSVGDRIRYARRHLGIGQQDLATRVGVTRSTIYQWESGTTEPSHKKLGLIAHALGLGMNELMTDQPDPPVQEKQEAEQTADTLGFERLAQLWLRLSDRDRRVLLQIVQVLAEDKPQLGPAVGEPDTE